MQMWHLDDEGIFQEPLLHVHLDDERVSDPHQVLLVREGRAERGTRRTPHTLPACQRERRVETKPLLVVLSRSSIPFPSLIRRKELKQEKTRRRSRRRMTGVAVTVQGGN